MAVRLRSSDASLRSHISEAINDEVPKASTSFLGSQSTHQRWLILQRVLRSLRARLFTVRALCVLIGLAAVLRLAVFVSVLSEGHRDVRIRPENSQAVRVVLQGGSQSENATTSGPSRSQVSPQHHRDGHADDKVLVQGCGVSPRDSPHLYHITVGGCQADGRLWCPLGSHAAEWDLCPTHDSIDRPATIIAALLPTPQPLPDCSPECAHPPPPSEPSPQARRRLRLAADDPEPPPAARDSHHRRHRTPHAPRAGGHRRGRDPCKLTACPEREAHASSLLALPDGALLCAWFAGHEGTGAVAIAVARRERPGNPGWSAAELVSRDAARSAQNPVLYHNPARGRTHLLHTSQEADAGQGGSVLLQLTSDDGG
eukprot:CAMPEP_0118938766 /NCGR_PEP_ID=MMETSP1169-20130426/26997_1 /TAXON_ID=36882 /ORGANISM="Pyramimonas obovata, Strain CCMP722" /LENGTH=370 /DNA_ID=CAMNT_0006882819 /DNA_START=341 /DNA_END=1449 /DNA_ORIENTATION=+